MYDALPNELKSKVKVSSKLTPEQFYEEIKDKFTVFRYKNDRVNNSNHEKQKTKSIHSNGDILDLNNIENKKRNIKSKFKISLTMGLTNIFLVLQMIKRNLNSEFHKKFY